MLSETRDDGLDARQLDTWLGASAPRRPESHPSPDRGALVPGREKKETYDPAQLESLLAALARHAGNVSKAASEVGINRQKAYRMLESAKKARR